MEGIAHPTVTIIGRETAAQAVNGVLANMAHQRYQITRGDSFVLSLLYGNGDTNDPDVLNWGAVNFDSRSGAALSFADLAEDESTLRTLCSEYLSQAGLAGDASDFLAEGNWYLTGDGLAVLTGSGSVAQATVIPYSLLLGTLKDEWIPPERLPVSGQLFAAYTADAAEENTRQLDEVTVSGGMESLLLWSRGDIQDVRVMLVETPDGATFTETALLWYASALKDGESVRVNATVPEGIPTLKLCWQTDLGAYEALVGRNGQTGKLQLIALSGEIIDADSPYAHITVQALLGHWYNDKTGAQGQSVSIAGSSICYLWHNGLGYNGEGFLWELVRRDAQDLCPQIVIHAANGDVVYDVEDLDDTQMITDAGKFFRAEAVG